MAIWDLKEIYKEIRSNTWAKASRGAWFGGGTPSATNVIQSLTIETLGNASDFGDLTAAKQRCAANASSTRAVITLVGDSASIDYKEWSSDGNASDFGDLTASLFKIGKMGGSETRAAFGGAALSTSEAGSDVMNIISPQILSSAVDFGNLSVARYAGAGGGNNIRGLYFGGYTYPANAASDVVDFITFATAGDATDFGNLSSAQIYNGGCGGKVRGFNMGGNKYPALESQIDYFTIATTGNASDFGDLNSASNYSAGQCENKIRALIGGLGSGATNIVEFITQATTGNSVDFGDLATSIKENNNGATSNNQSGITEDNIIQAPSVNYMPGSGRGIAFGGYAAPAPISTIELIHIPTLGNSSDFGDSHTAIAFGAANSSLTRTIMQGGYNDGLSTEVDQIQLIEHASRGNGSDFGNLLSTRANIASTGACSSTRGLSEGGGAGGSSVVNEIEYITMATIGNAADFGNLTVARELGASCSNGTRGVTGGGAAPGVSNVMDYVTIASTGNSTDFGNLTDARARNGALSSSTRGVFSGGDISPADSNTIDYITIASTGNATDFGNLSAAKTGPNGMSNPTRGVFVGGRTSPANLNVIEYITIASTGDVADFGDLSEVKEGVMCGSDSHGGLQG